MSVNKLLIKQDSDKKNPTKSQTALTLSMTSWPCVQWEALFQHSGLLVRMPGVSASQMI